MMSWSPGPRQDTGMMPAPGPWGRNFSTDRSKQQQGRRAITGQGWKNKGNVSNIKLCDYDGALKEHILLLGRLLDVIARSAAPRAPAVLAAFHWIQQSGQEIRQGNAQRWTWQGMQILQK